MTLAWAILKVCFTTSPFKTTILVKDSNGWKVAAP